MTVENETRADSLKMLEFQEGPFTRPLAIIYKRGRELSPAVRKFIDVLTSAGISPKAGAGREKAERPSRAERGERTTDASVEKAEKSA